jgi:hypothetical protein
MKRDYSGAAFVFTFASIFGFVIGVLGYNMYTRYEGFASAAGVIFGFLGIAIIGLGVILAIDTLKSKDIINDTIHDTQNKKRGN